MKTIKILFLKNKELKRYGVAAYQNSMLHLFKNIPNFKLTIVDDDFKVRSILVNNIFQSIKQLSILKFLLRYIYLIIKIRKHIRHVDFLFIPTYFRYGLLAISISSLFKIPFIVPLLGWGEEELSQRNASKIETFIKLQYSSLVYRNAKYILTSNDLMKGYSKIIKNKNTFLCIESPVDVNIFTPSPKSESLKNQLELNSKKNILTTAELDGVKAKGVEMLIEAFILIKKEYDNVILLIAGDGPRKRELEIIAKKSSVEDDIQFLGYCDNMPELINLSDVFTLILQFGGGIGAAIKEAMACEKPCVISRTSGTEILNDREEVLLVNYDAKDIADKILLILKDENYARRIGINARKKMENEYSLERTEEKLFEKLSEDRVS
jgi:glycosyltransferase involved in cell wall biosynthesis